MFIHIGSDSYCVGHRSKHVQIGRWALIFAAGVLLGHLDSSEKGGLFDVVVSKIFSNNFYIVS